MENTENIMGTKKVLPLLLTMAVPPTVSMLLQSLYNVVDSIFVARLNQDALTAVSIVYPLQYLILSVSVGFGVGLNSYIARCLGAKKKEETNLAAAHGFIFTLIHCLIFVLIGIFLTKPFMCLFTKDAAVFEYGCQYAYIVICFSFGNFFYIYFEKMMQAAGKMVVSMYLQLLGAAINIILDPVLIFGWLGFPAMGVRGAAVATVAGQIAATGLAVILFFKTNKDFSLSLKGFRFKKKITMEIYAVAVPAGITMSFSSILVGVLNGILSAVSETAVAVFGIYYKLQSFVYMPAFGMLQGMRPIVSYNYGADYKKRMDDSIKYSVYIVGIVMILGTLLFMVFPRQIMMLFNASGDLMALGVQALRIISIGFIVSTIGAVLAGAFEALGRGVPSLSITLTRQLVIILPLSAILSRYMGLPGVWLTFPVAECAGAILAVVLWRRKKI